MEEIKKVQNKVFNDFNQLGWHTLFICIIYEFLILSQVSNLIYMIFAGSVANVLGCGNETYVNLTLDEACSRYEKEKRSGCEPILKSEFHSVNHEFKYICKGATTVKMSTSVQMLGIMIGTMMFGQISDVIGRKKALIVGTVGLIVSGLLSSLANNLALFTAARFIVMLFAGGNYSVLYVYMMEMLPADHRMWIVTVITYSPNYILFAGLAYITENWRNLSQITATLTAIPLICLMFIEETPRWLLQKEKLEEVRKAVIAIGIWDNQNTPERLQAIEDALNVEYEKIRKADFPKKKYYTHHLFKYKQFATYTVVLSFSLATTSIITYGLMFNLDKLSGSQFQNTIMLGSMRYAINLIFAVIDIKFISAGRRLIHGFCMIFMICGLTLAFLLVTLGLEWNSMIRMISLSVSAMGTQIYILNAVVSAELFPTAIRNIGMGVVQTFNRLGNVIAPQIFLLGLSWPSLPYLVMTLLSLIDVVALLVLIPETKGNPLPDQMPDNADLGKHWLVEYNGEMKKRNDGSICPIQLKCNKC